MQRYRIVHKGVTDITDALDAKEDEGIGTITDTFSLRFKNVNGAYDTTFSINDNLDVYFGEGTATPTTLVMNGFITEILIEDTPDGKFIRLDGVNATERLLNCSFPVAEKAGTTASAIIGNLIDQANENSLSDYVLTKDIDNSSKSITYYSEYKTVYQHIETLSSPEYTDGSKYYDFWVDTANQFHWKARNLTSAGNIYEGSDTYGLTIKYGIFDVVNAVILNAGKDYNGYSITTYKTNESSVGEYGLKWKYIVMEDIANKAAADATGIGSVYNSANNDKFRLAVKNLANIEAQRIVTRLGGPTYKVELNVRGTNSYTKGRAYYIYTNRLGWNTSTTAKLLRLKEVGHIYDSKQGWITNLKFEEDEATRI